jgi:uncharacterized protein YndB with AHSA1/START domain
MIKKILLALVVIVAVILIYAATLPDSFRVQRSAAIKAPPEKVFALIEDFNSWPSWSPWEKLDPAMRRTISGAPKGKGAIYEWDGDKNVGAGRMEILEASPPSKVAIQLDFLRPFASQNSTVFTLEGKGDLTNVTWTMQGPSSYVTKLMSVFASMDSMIGKDFEKGLATMKSVAEK